MSYNNAILCSCGIQRTSNDRSSLQWYRQWVTSVSLQASSVRCWRLHRARCTAVSIINSGGPGLLGSAYSGLRSSAAERLAMGKHSELMRAIRS